MRFFSYVFMLLQDFTRKMKGQSPYLATIVLILFLALRTFIPMNEVIVTQKNLDKFPLNINDYQGIDIPLTESVYKELNPDIYIYRHYLPKFNNHPSILLYIGYYGTAKGGRTGHNPHACYPSAGWAILDLKKVILFISGKKVSINQIFIQKNEERRVVLYWYQSEGNKILDTGIKQNLHRFFCRILKRRDDGAFVRVSASINGNSKEILPKVYAFTKQILTLLPHYWPQEKEI